MPKLPLALALALIASADKQSEPKSSEPHAYPEKPSLAHPEKPSLPDKPPDLPNADLPNDYENESPETEEEVFDFFSHTHAPPYMSHSPFFLYLAPFFSF
tara:strand:+ start:91 stop:390 length:300 start_codon:yes stop_codon:yes gene_type:complete